MTLQPMCPECGHNMLQTVGGCCTVFVPGEAGDGMIAKYCDHDCYKAATGVTMLENFASIMWTGPASTDLTENYEDIDDEEEVP